MKDKFVFIVNPRSANGATLRMFERVRARFTAELGDIEVKLTTAPRHASVLARDAVNAGAKAVIAVGGDGTNNEVVNGFVDDNGAPLPGNTAFGVVTSGTGGDFRRSFGWKLDPLSDLQRIKRFATKRIDLGRLVRTPSGNTQETRTFLNISSFGVSGDVAQRVNESSKALGAKLSFMMGSVRAMASYQPKTVRMRFDGGAWQEKTVTLVAVCNAQYFGGGMQIAPGADTADGAFDVVIVDGGGFGFFLQHGMKLYSGKHIGLKEVTVVRCQALDVEPVGGADVAIDLDGESPGPLPARYELLPGAISLIV